MSLTLSHVQTPALTEAPPIYYGILTDQGQALLANAIASGIPLPLTQMAVGDGAGQPVTPQPEMTALVNEVHRAPLNQLFVDPTASNEIVAEMVMDETTGGFWIRELGLYDENGILFAVANAPASYKPVLAEGAGRALLTRMILIVSDTSAVELILNPDTVMASLAYVDAKIAEHAASRDHPAAAEDAQGMIPLATQAMVAEGTDHSSAVTPKTASEAFARQQHEHEIDDVLWLREELDEKAEVGHTHTPEEAGAAPAEHGHEIADIDGLLEALDGKSPTEHTHTPAQAGAAPAVHGHEITEVAGLQGALDGKSPTGHIHTPAEAGAAPAAHGHEIAEVAGLQGALDGKSPTGHTHTPSEIGAQPAAAGTILAQDWNTLTTPGIYSAQQENGPAGPNAPPANAGYGVLVVSNPGIFLVQEFHSHIGGALSQYWWRVLYADVSWTPWVQAAPAGLFNNTVQPGAALGVSYTNTTGYPMICTITTNHGGDDDQVRIWIGGTLVSTSSIAVSGEDSDGTQFSQTFVVPAGVAWQAEQYNGTESSITYFTQWQA